MNAILSLLRHRPRFYLRESWAIEPLSLELNHAPARGGRNGFGWVKRLTKILGYDPNEVMRAERNGFQGKGQARRLGRQETYDERKARLAAAGRDLAA